MTSFDDVLGTASLPPAPAFSVQNLVAPASAPGDAGSAVAPMASPATAANGGFGALNLAQLDGTAPQGGIFGPDTGRFMSSLGAGLSSAGQNWNKPAAAAFASGAGAALQGGQQWQNQLQDAKLKAIHAAIAAFRAGDVAAYHRSLADYHNTLAEEKRRHARPSAPPLPAVSEAEPVEAAAPTALPAPADQATADVPTVQPQVSVAHVRALDRLLADAGVPPDRVDVADLDRAARLMAAKAMPAAAAFETASLHNAMDAGHVEPAEVDRIYGPGVADAIRRTAAS